MSGEEAEIYSQNRLSVIFIEVSIPLEIQGFWKRRDSLRVILTRGTCSSNKEYVLSRKELREVLTSSSSIFRISAQFISLNLVLNCSWLNLDQSLQKPSAVFDLILGFLPKKKNWGRWSDIDTQSDCQK